MSRSCYSDECEHLELWRGAVKKATEGKRGQAFIKELITALDAMLEKKLIAEELEHKGAVCAIGSVGMARGVDMSDIDTYDYDRIGKIFDIAPALVREVEFINDEVWYTAPDEDLDVKRWQVVRNWAESQLIDSSTSEQLIKGDLE